MQITITIAPEDVKVLENDLVNIETWINEAVQGKIHACRKRMFRDWAPKLIGDGVIKGAVTDRDLVQAALSHPGYKNRKERERKK